MTVLPRRIYLDHNATAPLLPEARGAVLSALDLVGNPSSVHDHGRQARAVVEDARGAVARLVGADATGVVFTSGATEAANACLSPIWLVDGSLVCVSRLAVCDADHPATREGGRFDEAAITRLPVDAAGRLDRSAFDRWLDDAASPGDAAAPWSMLCLTYANSETGVLQEIAPVTDKLRGSKVLLVLDVSQAAGRVPLSMTTLGADALLLSGHKIGAPKGTGAYVLADEDRRPAPLLRGGGQEKGRRAGTEAVALVAGFGAAAQVAIARLADGGGRLDAMRFRLVAALRDSGASFAILGEDATCLPNTLCIAAPGMRAETAQIALDLQGFSVSSGSACSSGKVGQSHVLQAMHAGGLALDPSRGAIRISFGYETTETDIDPFASAFSRMLLRGQGAQKGQEAA